MNVKQGEKTDIFAVNVKGVTDYTDYYSNLVILDSSDDSVALGPNRINPVFGKFAVVLSPDETLSLPVGSYIAILEVIKEVDSVVEFRREVSWPIKISASLVNP